MLQAVICNCCYLGYMHGTCAWNQTDTPCTGNRSVSLVPIQLQQTYHGHSNVWGGRNSSSSNQKHLTCTVVKTRAMSAAEHVLTVIYITALGAHKTLAQVGTAFSSAVSVTV